MNCLHWQNLPKINWQWMLGICVSGHCVGRTSRTTAKKKSAIQAEIFYQKKKRKMLVTEGEKVIVGGIIAAKSAEIYQKQ